MLVKIAQDDSTDVQKSTSLVLFGFVGLAFRRKSKKINIE